MKRLAIVWDNELEEVSDNDIERALGDCANKFSWHPTIAEFKKLCLSYKGSNLIPWAEMSNAKKTESVARIINEGAKICKKLKEIYPELSWWLIASVFTRLKKQTKKFYPDHSEIEFLEELSKFDNEDLIDCLNVEAA